MNISILTDIFNKDFVPGVKYNNDKNSILEYRKFVFGNLIKIEDKIKENL